MDLTNGMLFKLNDKKESVFWLKGMKFPLDILFFDRNKRVIDIFERLTPCDECVLIKPSKPAAYALEINAGTAKKYGIRIGDAFEIEDD